ncbi:MAG TPA: hypothetical protein VED45_08415 [Steroidobacteraceae bacterium]|nr:hypothetical protein [Steroidobacteraceae bacterium]
MTARSLRRWATPILWAALAQPAVASADANTAATLQSALHACATLADAAERLACYDRLAGRSAAGPAAPSAAAPSVPGAAVPGPAAPVAAPPTAPAQPAAAAASNASAAAGTAAAPLPRESFGLYAAEHPQPAVATSLEARVIAVGTSEAGRMTVTLEGGALWELDDADPLLAAGQTVTITRASLGSYMMRTATKRTHRVRRLH